MDLPGDIAFQDNSKGCLSEHVEFAEGVKPLYGAGGSRGSTVAILGATERHMPNHMPPG